MKGRKEEAPGEHPITQDLLLDLLEVVIEENRRQKVKQYSMRYERGETFSLAYWSAYEAMEHVLVPAGTPVTEDNQTTAKWIRDHGYTDYVIACDSAEPKSIDDYRGAGLPARGAIKGPGSVDYGFKWLQTRTLVIDPERTPGAYREIMHYEYERTKDGRIISGYPDRDDHAISALRYAYEPLFYTRGTTA